MPSEELNGLIAIAGGLIIAVLAFVPVAAVHYRRHGRFTFVDLVALVAVLGSLLTVRLAQRLRTEGEPRPTRPTIGRRYVAMISDGLVMVMISTLVGVAWRVAQIQFRGVDAASIDLMHQALAQWGAVFAVEAVAVLVWGRTLGEFVVGLETVAPRRWWVGPGRVTKLLAGIGPVCVLAVWDSPASTPLLLVVLAATVVAAPFTPEHRGLANWIAGLGVRVVAPAPAQPLISPPLLDDVPSTERPSTGREGAGDDTVSR